MTQIKEATNTDFEVLYDLIMALAEDHGQSAYVLTSTVDMQRAHQNDPPLFGALIAYEDQKAVGFVSYTWQYSIWAGTMYMNIDDLFVQRDYRGRQIGAQLMEEARAICASKKDTYLRWEVETDNARAIQFYERLGGHYRTKAIFKWDVD